MKILLLLFSVLMATRLLAHDTSESYLSIKAHGTEFQGQWDIALRDLDRVLKLDTDGDLQISWGEVKAAEAPIKQLASVHLQLAPCPIQWNALKMADHPDGTYASLSWTASCPPDTAAWSISYTLFFEEDAWHKGLADITDERGVTALVFEPDHTRFRSDETLASLLPRYIREGIFHIWTGWDHILFLLTLLLPSVLALRRRTAFTRVLRIVTTFTVAHSLTLFIASMHWLQFSSKLIESVIALSIVFMALNIIFHFIDDRRELMVTFLFGLFHGLGFASNFVDTDQTMGQQVLAVFGFNLGVELGQFAIVLLVLPLLFAIRHRTQSRERLLNWGAGLAALMGMFWFLERL